MRAMALRPPFTTLPTSNVGNITRVMKYMERMPTEFQVLFMRSALRRDAKLSSTKSYMDWGIKNQSVLL